MRTENEDVHPESMRGRVALKLSSAVSQRIQDDAGGTQDGSPTTGRIRRSIFRRSFASTAGSMSARVRRRFCDEAEDSAVEKWG